MSAQTSAKTLSSTSTTLTPARGRRRGRAAGPSIPLGSLTQRENRAAIECQACGSTRVTRLTMNLTDGTPVEFTSCHRCEHRTWEHGGDALSVDSVLNRTRRD
jgi:DNA-directed RNA polymerase subunit M/transcription elongation factor TFIIS